MTALSLGCVLTALYIPFMAAPAKALGWMKGFPRNMWAGRILAFVDVVWVGLLLRVTPLGFLERYRVGFYILVPVAYFLIVKFMDELLAPRALGGLFLLVPTVMLKAVRDTGNESPLALFVVALAYIIAIKGIVLVLNPYQMRRMTERWITHEKACRAAGLAGLCISLTLIALSLTVYRS